MGARVLSLGFRVLNFMYFQSETQNSKPETVTAIKKITTLQKKISRQVLETALTYLPQEKQEELQVITTKIAEMIAPEMIILFGSYARNEWIEDSYVEDGITYEYQSDYDLLVVVKDERKVKPGTGKKIRRKIRKTDACDTPVSLIFHSLDYLNQELEEGSYFFSDLKKEGIAIYNPKEIKLAEAKELSPKHRQHKEFRISDFEFRTVCLETRDSKLKIRFDRPMTWKN